MRVRILVVDDDAGVREMIVRHLRFTGYEVAEAVDGADALGRVAQERFDIVVTDLRMPNLDGVDLIRRVRAEQPLIRIIAVTGQVTLAHAMDCLRHGAETLLLKPLDLGKLESAIERAIATEQRWLDLLRDLNRLKPDAGHG